MAEEKQTTQDVQAEEIEETAEAKDAAAASEETASGDALEGEEPKEDLEGSQEEEPEAEEPADTPQEESKEKTKKSFFGKKKDKKDPKDTKIEELTDRLQRNMAEFDNFRKRTEKEKASMYIIGAKEVVEKILPVVDNFERGLDTAAEGDAFADGMKMIYKQLMTVLEELGVKPIEAVGAQFDPDFHNAVMHVEDEEAGENVVVEEFQKGYTYKDFVVRHSMVKVAN
ncbi:MAG: nucleotide exchange factor GrpE [Blautia sp.]